MATFLEPQCKGGDSGVKQLQQNLFPLVTTPKSISPPGGFFMNFVLKANNLEDDENQELCLVKKESKELFAVVRDPSSTIQPARWPTECQVFTMHFLPLSVTYYYFSSIFLLAITHLSNKNLRISVIN